MSLKKVISSQLNSELFMPINVSARTAQKTPFIVVTSLGPRRKNRSSVAYGGHFLAKAVV
jgi:hypothetical protein